MHYGRSTFQKEDAKEYNQQVSSLPVCLGLTPEKEVALVKKYVVVKIAHHNFRAVTYQTKD